MSPADALRVMRLVIRGACGVRHQSQSHIPQLQPASLKPALFKPRYMVSLRHPA